MVEQLAMPPEAALKQLAEQAIRCERCPLYKEATQVVFGEGLAGARMMLVGEQPGDQEDRTGRPFVGPAGHLLDRAFEEIGLDRRTVYVTNAVKHFKHELRGKRRLHKRPDRYEIEQCRWWLDRELSLVDPHIVVALGVSAAQALTGRKVVLARERGKAVPLGEDRTLLLTTHPSAILRMPDEEARRHGFALLVADLRQAALLAAG